MDYIYKDSSGNKYVGEITGLEITPYYQFTLEINGESIWCHMEHILNEWCIHFIERKKTAELAHPTDIFWNTESIYNVFEDWETSEKIAYAVKSIYEKCNYEGVSY